MSKKEELDLLSVYLADVGRYKLLTAAEEVELAKLVERGDRIATETFINSNLRLVVKIAKRRQNERFARSLGLTDLIQAGTTEGLIKAVETFDYRRGCKFSTHATPLIEAAIKRTIANDARTIRVPVHVHGEASLITRATDTLTQRLQRTPTTDEIAAETGLTEERVRRTGHAYLATREIASLDDDTLKGEGENGKVVTLHDVLPDPNDRTDHGRDFFTEYEESENLRVSKQTLRPLVDALGPRERQVVRLSYGLNRDDEWPYTLVEIAWKLNVSSETVRKIETSAVRQLAAAYKLRPASVESTQALVTRQAWRSIVPVRYKNRTGLKRSETVYVCQSCGHVAGTERPSQCPGRGVPPWPLGIYDELKNVCESQKFVKVRRKSLFVCRICGHQHVGATPSVCGNYQVNRAAYCESRQFDKSNVCDVEAMPFGRVWLPE